MESQAGLGAGRSALRTLCALALVAGILAVAATAPADPLPRDPRIEGWIRYWTERVESWRREGQVCLWLTLTAGGLGVIVGALQLMRRKWLQAALFCAGALISVLTLVTNTRYSADFRGYQRLVARADHLVQEMRDAGSSYATDEERRFAVDRVLRLNDQLAKLEDAFLQGSVALSAPAPNPAPSGNSLDLLGHVFGVAYAMSLTDGSCARHAASDAGNLYFVGLGSEASLDLAQKLSRRSADQALVDDLRSQIPAGSPVDAEALARFLAQVVSVEDVCYERPSAARPGYRVFTVLRLPRSALEAAPTLYGAREQVNVPGDTAQALTRVAPSTVDYTIARQDTYDRLAKAARESTPTEAYRDYEEGRRARQAKDCTRARASLGAALRAKPDFFLALYNLGLTEDECGNPAGAGEAYRRAAAVADQQAVRDASFRNTFGWFLYRQKDYAAATTQFEQALKLEPAHPLARKNLSAARAAQASR